MSWVNVLRLYVSGSRAVYDAEKPSQQTTTAVVIFFVLCKVALQWLICAVSSAT